MPASSASQLCQGKTFCQRNDLRVHRRGSALRGKQSAFTHGGFGFIYHPQKRAAAVFRAHGFKYFKVSYGVYVKAHKLFFVIWTYSINVIKPAHTVIAKIFYKYVKRRNLRRVNSQTDCRNITGFEVFDNIRRVKTN